MTEANQADRNGILAGLSGYPAIDLPTSFSAPTASTPLRVPVGMDLLGRPFSEGRLLGLAYAYEQAEGSHRLPASTLPLASPLARARSRQTARHPQRLNRRRGVFGSPVG